MSEINNLLIILGPTGVGKSRTAVRIARVFHGEIINCDSMQVYRGFDIGTDKITGPDRENIPHHLLDIIDPNIQFTVADFIDHALRAAREITVREALPILTGGTGMYLTAFIRGLFPGGKQNPGIRKKLETEAEEQGLRSLWERLQKADPHYAQIIGENDRIRIIRALEVYESTGRPISEQFAETRPPSREYHILKIGLIDDRDKLYQRIEDRVDRMFELGLVQEVTSLLEIGVSPDAPPFRALGYKQVLKFLRNDLDREEMVAETKKATRHYAKRQLTWFRKMEGIRWFRPPETEAMIQWLKSEGI